MSSEYIYRESDLVRVGCVTLQSATKMWAHQISLLQFNKAEPHSDGSNTELQGCRGLLWPLGRPSLYFSRHASAVEACAPRPRLAAPHRSPVSELHGSMDFSEIVHIQAVRV